MSHKVDWKVKRRDSCNGADWKSLRDGKITFTRRGPVHRNGLTGETFCLFRSDGEGGDGSIPLGGRILPGFSGLGHDEPGDFILLLTDLRGDSRQNFGPPI